MCHADTKVSGKGAREGHKSSISLQPLMGRWTEPLHPLEINGGEKSHLQPMEDPMLEHGTGPEKGCYSEGVLCWSSPSLGGHSLQKGPTCGPHVAN